MDERKLEQLHNALLYITDEIDRICRKENIKYTLTGGSLIGAVRHKGFIPWDDDMDIAMRREDYEKFISACDKELREEFFLQTIERDIDYTYGFAKLTLVGTTYQQEGYEGEKWQKGIFVDIFPMDNIPKKKISKFLHKNINYILIKLLEYRDSTSWKNKRGYKRLGGKMLNLLSKIFTVKKLTSFLQNNMKKYDCFNTKEICNLAGFYKYDKESTLKIYYDEYIEVSYSNRKYDIIKEYDNYLKNIYGDYMKMPPVTDRHTHNFSVLEFGNYDF